MNVGSSGHRCWFNFASWPHCNSLSIIISILLYYPLSSCLRKHFTTRAVLMLSYCFNKMSSFYSCICAYELVFAYLQWLLPIVSRFSVSGSSHVSVSGTWSKGQGGSCQGRDLALSALAHRSVRYGLSHEFRHQVEECLFLGLKMGRTSVRN